MWLLPLSVKILSIHPYRGLEMRNYVTTYTAVPINAYADYSGIKRGPAFSVLAWINELFEILLSVWKPVFFVYLLAYGQPDILDSLRFGLCKWVGYEQQCSK
jgi:hypothetical protein